MQRLSGIVLTAAVLLLSPFAGAGSAYAQQNPFDSDIVLNTVAIRASATADYERIMDRLREGLVNSDDPVRNRMARGWTLIRQTNRMPNGDVIYVHLITTVSGADYSIMQTLYDEFPEERQALYEMYQGAFSQNLGAAGGNIVLDMSR
jgi:hypothetical protein